MCSRNLASNQMGFNLYKVAEKLRLCYALSQDKIKQLRIALMDLKVVKQSFFVIPISSLVADGESLLCDYPTVAGYILEINLTKRERMILFTFNGPI